jgi:hypothetical protein
MNEVSLLVHSLKVTRRRGVLTKLYDLEDCTKVKGTKVFFFFFFLKIIFKLLLLLLNLFLGLNYQVKDIIGFTFIIEYNSLRDFGP